MKTIGLVMQVIGGFIFGAALLFVIVMNFIFDGMAGSTKVGLQSQLLSALPVLLPSFSIFALGKYLRDTK